jgi:gliding motility-associated-like protein
MILIAIVPNPGFVLNYIKAAYFILLALLNYTAGNAQTCNGSLGDPVVNITFGAGAASAGPLPFNVTSYTYSTNPCPGDGFYTIVSQSSGCGMSWHSVTEDHTPLDANGNMMLVNASYQPGDFYKQKVTGLCGGTTYEFSAWILNILMTSACGSTGIDPNITFTIENSNGTIIQSYNTGDIVEAVNPAWKPYGFYFTTPLGSEEVVIRMTNNSPGGCGNDLILDDITFRACGPTVLAEGNTTYVNNKLCEGENGSVSLNGNISSGYINPSFQWQLNSNDGNGWKDIPGSNQLAYSFSIPVVTANDYQFRLAVAEGLNINSLNCRVISEIVLVETSKKPTADAGEDIVLIEGESVSLNGSVDGTNLRYFWTPSSYLDNPDILKPKASPPENITYTLNVFSEDGCNLMATDQVDIRVLMNLKIPNAFSPNADLINDYWEIAALNTYPEARIRVFNRYGQTVFKSVGYDEEWDGNFEGNPLPAGVYYYTIDLKTESPILKGSVLIMR